MQKWMCLYDRYKDYSSNCKKRWNYMLSWKELSRRMLQNSQVHRVSLIRFVTCYVSFGFSDICFGMEADFTCPSIFWFRLKIYYHLPCIFLLRVPSCSLGSFVFVLKKGWDVGWGELNFSDSNFFNEDMGCSSFLICLIDIAYIFFTLAYFGILVFYHKRIVWQNNVTVTARIFWGAINCTPLF